MKIAGAGGRETADYLTGLLREAGHKVAVIQEDRAFCEHLSAKYDMSVTCGDPCREDVLADAGIRGCGLFLALLPEDADNLDVIYITHAGAPEEAKKLAETIKKNYKVGEIRYSSIGPVVGCHTGPGTIAVVFFGTRSDAK